MPSSQVDNGGRVRAREAAHAPTHAPTEPNRHVQVAAKSRGAKRLLGPIAWVILEDLALDAPPHQPCPAVGIDIQRIARNLALDPATVHHHLQRLHDYGYVRATQDAGRTGAALDHQRVTLNAADITTQTSAPSQPVTAPTPIRCHSGGRDDLPLAARLAAAGIADGVAHDMVARYPAGQITDALDVLPARPNVDAVAWLVQAISQVWPLHHEAQRIRAADTRRRQRGAAERANHTAQQRRDRDIDGWANALADALTDAQLALAVARVARPVGGLDRLSAPLATTQLLAWAITTTTAAPDTPLDKALGDALRSGRTDPSAMPDDIPEPPTSRAPAEPDAFRQRVKQAIEALDPTDPTRHIGHVEQQGISHDR